MGCLWMWGQALYPQTSPSTPVLTGAYQLIKFEKKKKEGGLGLRGFKAWDKRVWEWPFQAAKTDLHEGGGYVRVS